MKASPREQELMAQLPIGSIVKHYKAENGHKMRVLAIARHTEDGNLHVVYQKLYNCEKFGDHVIVVRPLEMFMEKVLVDGQEVPRFEVVETPACSCC